MDGDSDRDQPKQAQDVADPTSDANVEAGASLNSDAAPETANVEKEGEPLGANFA